MRERSAFPVLWQGPPRELKELQRLGCPRSVPWDLVEPHERRALRNHSQTLKRLAERGGLSPKELVAVLTDRHWSDVLRLTEADAVAELKQHVARFAGAKGGDR